MDKFYSLVTDLYEWGWGQSFHFARKLPNKDWAASEAAHETWAAATIRLGPGKTALDVGCGVGGPMRTVAAVRWARNALSLADGCIHSLGRMPLAGLPLA